MKNRITVITLVLTMALGSGAFSNLISAEEKENDLHLISGTLVKLDLDNKKGVLTTDLGRPIYFEVPKAYLFENVSVGDQISLRLDDEGRAVKVMDASIPDVMVTPAAKSALPAMATQLEEPIAR